MKTSDVLRRAGDVLRERGWCQHGLLNARGSVCLLGACHQAIDGEPTGHAGLSFPGLMEVLDAAIGAVPGHERAIWNDSPGRTAAEVMIALDAAYVVALQEEGDEPGDVL